MKSNIRKFVTLAMLGALAYVTMLLVRVPFPAASFLRYDPKDVFIIIGGFIYGPLAAVGLAVAVPVIRFMTVATTGPVGLLMNIVSSASFAVTASLIYSKHRTIKGAVIGLAVGVLAVTGMMMLWNYIITPIYQGVPRVVVVRMLIPVFMPFNLMKGIFNAAIIMLIYKRLAGALHRLELLSEETEMQSGASLSIILASIFAVTTVALVALAMLDFI